MNGERELTDALRSFFGTNRDVLVPLGDDAAVVRAPKGAMVLCCDPVVEGVHFLAETPLRLVGRKAVNRNLSDLAAMGATPSWLLCSVVAPKGLGRGEVAQTEARHRRPLLEERRVDLRDEPVEVVVEPEHAEVLPSGPRHQI